MILIVSVVALKILSQDAGYIRYPPFYNQYVII